MKNVLDNVLSWIAQNFRKDASKMLIWTGVAGWTLSSLAQVGAVLFNNKISNEKKSFLVPQEMADAAVNIGSFFLITQAAKKMTAKLFSTGKFAPKTVRTYLEKNKDLYAKKIGKLDFDLDEVLKKNNDFPKDEYYACKNFGTTLATVGAGIVSSNIVTPIIRNNMASKMQQNYISKKQTEVPQVTRPTGMRV
ncbi:MAG: hypothetical protein NC408_03105 [Candidatus Gastranaerophilales bacterium]|nr:hypothetical protein [Candidatus Gastranaerophilales bacterium]MCM1073265.1 hypothetical protein [Bacteroides sp.]